MNQGTEPGACMLSHVNDNTLGKDPQTRVLQALDPVSSFLFFFHSFFFHPFLRVASLIFKIFHQISSILPINFLLIVKISHAVGIFCFVLFLLLSH